MGEALRMKHRLYEGRGRQGILGKDFSGTIIRVNNAVLVSHRTSVGRSVCSCHVHGMHVECAYSGFHHVVDEI